MPQSSPREPCITAVCTANCVGRTEEDPEVITAFPKGCVVTKRTFVKTRRVVKPEHRREDNYCIIEKPVKAVLPAKACELLDQLARGETVSAVLLGPPGTGKTTFLELVEKTAPVNIIRLNPESLLSKYIGETEKKFREILDRCEQSEPCMLLVDEGDLLIEKRSSGETEQGYERVTDNIKREFLRRSQEWYNKGRKIGILITSNRHISVLETANLREGRLGEPIYFPIPDTKSLRILFRLYGKPVPSDEELQELIRQSASFSNIVAYIKTGKLKKFQVAPFAVLEHAPRKKLKIRLSQRARIVIPEEFPLNARIAALISSSLFNKPVLVLKDSSKLMDLFYLGESMMLPVGIPYNNYQPDVPKLFYNYSYPVFFLGKGWVDVQYAAITLDDIISQLGDDETYRAICGEDPGPVLANIRTEILRCLSGFSHI